MMEKHPSVSAFVHTPFVYLVLLGLGFLFLRAERQLKKPYILARFINSRIIANVHTNPMGILLGAPDSPAKVNWEWFIEVQLTNDSETPTTIEDIEARVRIKRKPWKKEAVLVKHVGDLSQFHIDMALDYNGNGNSEPFVEPRYRPVPSLITEIHKIPLSRGIGYRGWLRFQVKQVSQPDMNGGKMSIDVWLVDALQGKHKLDYKKNSENHWDKNFYILST